jgi:regulator of protease activity HflC (stomatin/prohibitin superfamily)
MVEFTIVFFVVLYIIYKTFIIVPEKSAYVVERLGVYRGTFEAGFHFLIPLVDQIRYKQLLKEIAIDVPPQICITKDNVSVEVDGILYLLITDAQKASYGIENFYSATVQLAQTTLRSEIGKLHLDQTFAERELINNHVVEQLDVATDPWGIKVTRYEIRNINPPKQILLEMENQMKAEREKRAEITISEGEREGRINRSLGERKEAIQISEGEKIRLTNEAQGKAIEMETIAKATAEGIKLVAQAIQMKHGKEAVQLQIMKDYTQTLSKILEKSETTVVPTPVASLQSLLEGVTKITNPLKGGK